MVAGSSAAADGRVRAGDLLLATSASFGEQMWQKSTLEGVSSATPTPSPDPNPDPNHDPNPHPHPCPHPLLLLTLNKHSDRSKANG